MKTFRYFIRSFLIEPLIYLLTIECHGLMIKLYYVDLGGFPDFKESLITLFFLGILLGFEANIIKKEKIRMHREKIINLPFGEPKPGFIENIKTIVKDFKRGKANDSQ